VISEASKSAGRFPHAAPNGVVFRPGDRITIRAKTDARFMMLGGEPMDGARYIWWNFVSSRKERIEQAKADWNQGRFDSVPEDREFIPLPEPEPPLDRRS